MNLDNRKYVVVLMIIIVGFIFLLRLIYMQGIDKSWSERAIRITEKAIVLKPPRGLVYDRNGELLIANQAVYDLMVIPNEIENLDTALLARILNKDVADVRKRLREINKATSWQAQEFVTHILPADYSRLSEQLFKFKGFFSRPGTMRNYPHKTAPLVVGDVGKISPHELEGNEYYDNQDYIGKGGIEQAYEEDLRGKKGLRYFFRDNKGLLQEVAEGRLNTLSEPGKNLIATIDIELQKYGELLMQNKKGCIVAIEPATGEILCLVSSPKYDPNRLIGQLRSENFEQLKSDTLGPLYNRAIKGLYRPGSIFKMVQALVALENGFITPQTRIRCRRNIIGCHGAHFNDNLPQAIQHSCNPYFREVMNRMVESGAVESKFADASLGLNSWHDHIAKFGFGSNLNTDIPGVKRGSLPSSGYYDNIYGKGRWAYSTIYSLSIGEGELLFTPLQMANLAAIIANRGWFFNPHIIKDIAGAGIKPEFEKKNYVGVSADNFDPVVQAMQTVVEKPGGTASRARIKGIEVCGKTGTVQNDPIPDHSVFIAFAPKDNPQIAISVYVEFSGFGGTWAAPIASLIMEKYLTDTIVNPRKEQRILDAQFLDY